MATTNCPPPNPASVWAIAWEVVREPMFLLLIGASAIYLALGDIREALVLFASVFVVMGITFYQERKTERALEALRELSSPRAQVLRDGDWQSVPGREVVLGDVVRIKEGDRVPADAALFSCNNLTADESLLTGESVPVRKRAGRALRRRRRDREATICPSSTAERCSPRVRESRAWSRPGCAPRSAR